MRFWIVLIVLVCGLFGSVGPGRAGTISYNGYTLLNSQTVQLGGSVNESGLAGQISYQNLSGYAGMLATFCVDVYANLQSAGSFTTGSIVNGAFGDTVNALLSHVVPTLPTDPNASAALQVAIWEAEYGSRLTVTGPSAVISLANAYLANVNGGTWRVDRAQQVALLTGVNGNQSQAYLVAVPEPASLLLVGAGVAAVMLVRRARSRV